MNIELLMMTSLTQGAKQNTPSNLAKFKKHA